MIYRALMGFILGLSLLGCGPNVQDGVAAYNDKHYDKALEIFQKTNDRDARYHLYLMADKGRGMPKNESQAIEYLKHAASKEHPEAMAELGHKLLNGTGVPKDTEQGLAYLTKAIDAGNIDANVDLGNYLIEEKKIELGLTHLHAAESTWRGKYALALYYEDASDNAIKNPKKSIKYFQEILQMKDVSESVSDNSRLKLAELFYYGWGTSQNFTAAAKTLEPALETEDYSKNFYAWLLYHGEGLAANKPKAVKIWLANVDKADPFGYMPTGLAKAYASGEGVALDKNKALAYFNKIYHFGPGLFFKTILKSQKFLDSDCTAEYLGKEAGRYQSLAGKAHLAQTRCLFENAKKKKGNDRESAMFDVRMSLGNAISVNAPGIAELSQEITIWQANGGVIIGMTKDQVLASKWGRPRRIYKTISASGTSEQWAYESEKYLFFKNGLLETINY